MQKFLAMAMAGGLTLAVQAARPQSQQLARPDPTTQPADPHAGPGNSSAPPESVPPPEAAAPNDSEDAARYLPSLPAAPKGKSTIMGGQIRDVDPVRDQFALHVYGQRPVKILYDERTQVFRDGVKISLRDLGSEDRASVQTILDGANVFALSVHILSQAAQGECEGRVSYFDPRTNMLAVTSDISPQPVRLFVPESTQITRVGEPEFTASRPGLADLMTGALITATFTSDRNGHDVAKEITVLAVPGAGFTFSGNISFLDLHNGTLVLVDPRDQKSYQIHLDAARVSSGENLRAGVNVTVKAIYDGRQYEAGEITVNSN
jgi:hypothetical protein